MQHIAQSFNVSCLALYYTDLSSISVELLVSSYSLVEVECSFFRVLMLNCGTLLSDPETLVFAETASAEKRPQ